MTGQNINAPAQLVSAATAGDPQAQFQLALQALQQNRQDEFQHWIKQAVEQNFPPALFRYGIWLLARVETLEETEYAKDLVRKAADLGFINAIRAMAMISTRGAGVLPDWDEGLRWFKLAVQKNDPRALCEAGLLLLNNEGNEETTKALLKFSATAGNVLAAYHLGCLQISSQEELDAGLYWLKQAKEAGHILAVKEMEPFAGRKIEQPEFNLPSLDWNDLDLKLSGIKEPEEELPSISVITSPKVRRVPNVLKKWECDYLIGRAYPILRPAMTVESTVKGEEKSDYRDNTLAKFWIAQQDIVVSLIERKIAKVGKAALDFAEDLSVLNYKPGEQNRPHYDSFLADTPEQVYEIEKHGQRIRTCLVYLNDDFEGGATNFPRAETSTKGGVGEAVIFENINEDGSADLNSIHAGLPVTSGEKWVVTKWVRDRSQNVIQNQEVK